MIGIALDRGALTTVHQPLLELFPDHPMANVDARKRAITLEHVLTMTTGLHCRDSHLYNWAGFGEMRQSQDWASFVLDLPMAAVPGERFEYCNGASYLLSVILQQATQMRALDFAKTHLFEPLGITEVRWRTSPQGVDIGWGEMWLTPHDMATLERVYFSAFIWAIPADTPLADIGPTFYVPFLKKFGFDVTVLTNHAITLRDGSPAYRTSIRSTLPNGVIRTSIFVTAFREGKWVVVAVHPGQDVPTYAPIAESLTFK